MKEADRRQLGYRIRVAREAMREGGKKWTQTDLARAIGAKRGVICAYETGTIVNPSMTVLQAIAEACNVPVTEFLIEAGVSLPEAPTGQLQWIAAQLNRENIERLVGLAHVLLEVQHRRPRKGER